MFIYEYTVKICSQHLNCTKTAKDEPYIYCAVDLTDEELKELTKDTLNKMLLDCQSIEAKLQMEIMER